MIVTYLYKLLLAHFHVADLLDHVKVFCVPFDFGIYGLNVTFHILVNLMLRVRTASAIVSTLSELRLIKTLVKLVLSFLIRT